MASFYARRDGVVATFGGCHISAGIDFAMPANAQDYHKRLSAFMTEFVFPAEAEYDCHRIEAGPNDHTLPPIVEELKAPGQVAMAVESLPAHDLGADQSGVRAAGRADRLEPKSISVHRSASARVRLAFNRVLRQQ